MEDLKGLSLVNIEGGAAVEMFDRALARVAANIADINTTLGAREIRLIVKLKPSRDRGLGEIDLGVQTKLAGQEPIKATVLIGQDDDGAPQLFAKVSPQTEIPFRVREGGKQ